MPRLIKQYKIKQCSKQVGINSGITGTTGELGANMGQTISQSGRAFPNIGTTGAQGATIGQSYRPDFMATATKNVNVPTAQFGEDYGFSDVARELGEVMLLKAI